jgi:hypothetical protein
MIDWSGCFGTLSEIAQCVESCGREKLLTLWPGNGREKEGAGVSQFSSKAHYNNLKTAY